MDNSNAKASVALGLYEKRLSQIKFNNIEKYSFLLSFDENKIKSVHMYAVYVESVIKEMENLLISYEDKKCELWRVFLSLNLTKNYSNSSLFFKREEENVFKIREFTDILRITFSLLQKWVKVLTYFKKDI